MKTYIITLFFIISIYQLNSQNLIWDYTVANNGTTSTLTVRAKKINSGTENVLSFNYGFYYKSAETTVFGIPPGGTNSFFSTGLLNGAINGTLAGWSPEMTGAVVASSNVPGYDRLFIGSITDGNFMGSDISTVPIPILTLKFDNTTGNPSFGDFIYMGGSDTNPAWKYSDINFTEYNVVADPTSRSQVLPIILSELNLTKYNKNSSLLTWSTSSEVNSDYFNIERSQDGNKWETIGKVDAAGTSNRKNNYKFLDENLKLDKEENIFYYRLKMVDIDGIYKYSEIRNILFTNEKNKIIAFPNPTREVLNLDLSGMELSRGDISIILFDEAGRNVLLRKNVNNSLHTIELKDLPAGNYNVVVKQNEDIYLNKIVKIK